MGIKLYQSHTSCSVLKFTVAFIGTTAHEVYDLNGVF